MSCSRWTVSVIALDVELAAQEVVCLSHAAAFIVQRKLDIVLVALLWFSQVYFRESKVLACVAHIVVNYVVCHGAWENGVDDSSSCGIGSDAVILVDVIVLYYVIEFGFIVLFRTSLSWIADISLIWMILLARVEFFQRSLQTSATVLARPCPACENIVGINFTVALDSLLISIWLPYRRIVLNSQGLKIRFVDIIQS